VERIKSQRFAEEVAQGLDYIPSPLLERIGGVHFFEGDLHFAGYWPRCHDSYASAYSPKHLHHLPAHRRCPTVTASTSPHHRRFGLPPYVVVHEMHHCLQWALGSYDDRWPWPLREKAGLPNLPVITSYKPDLYVEQFCEAAAAWLMPRFLLPGRYRGSAERLWEGGRGWLAMMNGLVGWPSDLPPRSLRVG